MRTLDTPPTLKDRGFPACTDKTGAVRGVIHSRCNLLLGYARDDEKTLANAIAYLKDTPAAVFFSQEEYLDY